MTKVLALVVLLGGCATLHHKDVPPIAVRLLPGTHLVTHSTCETKCIGMSCIQVCQQRDELFTDAEQDVVLPARSRAATPVADTTWLDPWDPPTPPTPTR